MLLFIDYSVVKLQMNGIFLKVVLWPGTTLPARCFLFFHSAMPGKRQTFTYEFMKTKTIDVFHFPLPMPKESETLPGTLARCLSLVFDWGAESGVWKAPSTFIREDLP